MQSLQKATMSLLVFVLFTIILMTRAHAALEPQELVGEYLGSGDCGVVVSVYGDDQLRFSIRKGGREVAYDFLPFYRLETLTSPDSFEFERETVGASGDEKRVVSLTIRGRRLGSLKLKQVRSVFSFTSKSCLGLTPLAPYMSDF